MKSRFRTCALLAALALPLAAQEAAPAPTLAVAIGEAGLLIDRPAEWRAGLMGGPSILLHFIGSGDGFPQFTVMSDAEAALDPEAAPDRVRDAVEDLFSDITAGGDRVIEAGWQEIGGIEVHASLATRSSVAGSITRRRLLFVYGGVPYVLIWAHYSDRYEDIAAIVERCVNSLREGRTGGRIAALVARRP